MKGNLLEHTALALIDELIACWTNWESNEDYYLTALAPSIVRSFGSAGLNDREREIVAALRRRLSQEEWHRLPALIAQRRAGKLKELDSDRERAEALRKAERERLRAEEAQIARKRALATRLEGVFESDFLSADEALAGNPDVGLITVSEYEERKTNFVRDWADRELGQSLDAEQAAAVAVTSGDVQVVARAGSGKTRTLVTRAVFLQKHCGVSPREILLLAFNKKAAREMEDRLAEFLGENLPHAMTFHALAHALVQPEEELVFDDASVDQFGLSREVQKVIDEHLRSREYGGRIRALLLAHFREDWERVMNNRFQLTMKESLIHRRALTHESLKGDYVKSFGEKVIANALFEHGIEYKYESNFRWGGVNYRPDFKIPIGSKGGVIVEYFGLEGDADYDRMSQEKRRFWAERDEWTFVEFSPTDLRRNCEDGFVRLLLERLGKAGVSYRRRSEEEIWHLIRRRALGGFKSAMRAFVGRCRKRVLSPDDLESMITGYAPRSATETQFLDVGVSVYRGYLQRLIANEKEDFDGLVWRAAKLVGEGETRFVRDKGKERGDVGQLRFVLIDEFQDFSESFFELVDAVRSANQDVQFFCVGDDWQAINGFAGSELRYFADFAAYFRETSQRHVRTNYRSARSVVEAGNALMEGRGLTAKPKPGAGAGSVLLCKLNEFRPSVPERGIHDGDEVTPALLRLVRCYLDRGKDVVLLSRRNGVPWYVNYGKTAAGASDRLGRFLQHIRSFLPEEDGERVTISTAHGFKGLEQSAVIVLDAVRRSYPLIHPHSVFLRVFGDSIDRIEAEERRLFYVAITRAKDSLALLTETPSHSPYLDDIRRHVRLTELAWADLPPVPSLDSARFKIRVFGAYNVKDQLKDLNYRWNAAGRYWQRSVMAEGFSFDALLRQPWAVNGVRLEVYSEMEELLYWR